MTNPLYARVVEDCPHHFVMEWEGGKAPVNAIVGPYKVIKLGDCQLLGDSKARLIGFFVELPQSEGEPRRRILIGTDHDSAFNPDGSPCRIATTQELEWLSRAASPLRADPTMQHDIMPRRRLG